MSESWSRDLDPSVREVPTEEGLPALALAAGLVAALIGGAIWAALGIWANLEIGWAAWGIGVLVGVAMAMTTRSRSRKLAVVAAALAVVGLATGKALTFAGSAGPIAEEMVADAGYMQGLTAWSLYANGELGAPLQAAVEATEARGDTLSDALWAEMLAAAEARMASMTEDELRAIARGVAGGMIREMGLVAGIRAQMSAFDFLWILLAVATAGRIMDLPKAEAAVAGPVRPEGAERPEEKELV